MVLLNINLQKFIKQSNNYRCELSRVLLEFLESSKTSICVIDLSGCIEISFIFDEILNHFDLWFPKRVEIINY